MKKSQASQAFTYIALLIVVGAIALVGYKSISAIMDANCESKKADFSSDLGKFIDRYSDRGSVHTETLTLPCGVNEVYLVDASLFNDQTALMGVPGVEAVITSSVQDGSYNIFAKGKFMEPVLKAEKLKINSNVLRIPATGSYLKLRFTGQGRSTLVEQG